MALRTQLQDLASRLAAATGPDRQLDCLMAMLCDGFFKVPPRYEGDVVGYGFERQGMRTLPGFGGDQLVPAYTGSIDAIEALRQRVLPDSEIGVQILSGLPARCVIKKCEHCSVGDAPTEPLARSQALVAALIASSAADAA